MNTDEILQAVLLRQTQGEDLLHHLPEPRALPEPLSQRSQPVQVRRHRKKRARGPRK